MLVGPPCLSLLQTARQEARIFARSGAKSTARGQLAKNYKCKVSVCRSQTSFDMFFAVVLVAWHAFPQPVSVRKRKSIPAPLQGVECGQARRGRHVCPSAAVRPECTEFPEPCPLDERPRTLKLPCACVELLGPCVSTSRKWHGSRSKRCSP